MKTIVLFVTILMLLSACKNDNDDAVTNPEASEVALKAGFDLFTNAMAQRDQSVGDPFDLLALHFNDDIVKITVGYSGGCRKHAFELIWGEQIISGNPPSVNMILIHNANGDNCEAYITEELVFNVSEFMDAHAVKNLSIGIYNGYYPDDELLFESPQYDFDFEEGDECVIYVTASKVICGAGLYNNLWFAMDKSTPSEYNDFSFFYYLQPVALDASLAGFVPQEGKRYRVGVRLESNHIFNEVPVCLAYSGPSVPVRVMCIQELE